MTLLMSLYTGVAGANSEGFKLLSLISQVVFIIFVLLKPTRPFLARTVLDLNNKQEMAHSNPWLSLSAGRNSV